MKKSTYIISFAFVGLVLIGCNNQEAKLVNKETTMETKIGPTQTNVSTNNDNIVTSIESTADIIDNFENVDDLINASEIIVQGKVLGTNSYVLEPGVVTEYKLEVTDSLQGGFENGSVIDIVGAGGIVPYSEYEEKLKPVEKDFEEKLSEEQKKNGKVKYIFAGTPLIEVGQEYIIFASKYPVGEKLMYGAVGVYQGQYKIEGNQVTRHDPGSQEKDKLKKEEKDIFTKKVKEKVKNKEIK